MEAAYSGQEMERQRQRGRQTVTERRAFFQALETDECVI